ncbi:hypothetical protein ACFYUH_06770 [Streptomyces fimicarius]
MADAPVRCAGRMSVSVPTPTPTPMPIADADTEGAYVPGDFGQ